jgi:streptomycin 6-kinase
VIKTIAADWELELGAPYLPGGQVAWVAPVTNRRGERLALKVGWRHSEAEHEADALRVHDGDGAVRCLADDRSHAGTNALLLERCEPGTQLKAALPEPAQDEVVAGLLRRLWAHVPAPGDPFRTLVEICDEWARAFELGLERQRQGIDPGLAREGVTLLRSLPREASRSVLLSTDLHAGNILSSGREPWLAVDPKPFLGDPAFDVVQHMFNCEERLAADADAFATRMAELTDTDPRRVRLWLFARCVQESLGDLPARELARRLAP